MVSWHCSIFLFIARCTQGQLMRLSFLLNSFGQIENDINVSSCNLQSAFPLTISARLFLGRVNEHPWWGSWRQPEKCLMLLFPLGQAEKCLLYPEARIHLCRQCEELQQNKMTIPLTKGQRQAFWSKFKSETENQPCRRWNGGRDGAPLHPERRCIWQPGTILILLETFNLDSLLLGLSGGSIQPGFGIPCCKTHPWYYNQSKYYETQLQVSIREGSEEKKYNYFFLKMNHWCVKQILHLVPSKYLCICFCISVYICPK